MKWMWLASAGAAGTLARYGLAELAPKAVQRFGPWIGITNAQTFPWGTATVNWVGCFLFGAIAALADHRMKLDQETKWILLTGFMGAFTTFSTFAYESRNMLESQEWGMLTVNILLQNALGIFLIFLGWTVVCRW